jgi:hypothetical protein
VLSLGLIRKKQTLRYFLDLTEREKMALVDNQIGVQKVELA